MTDARTLTDRLGDFARRAREAGTSLELHHVSRGLVSKWDKEEPLPSGADIELVAVDHAAALHGRQGYELRAVYPEGGTKQAIPFRVTGASSESDAASEPASEKGVIAMLQKQNDRLLAAVERAGKPTVDALETLGKMLAAQLAQQEALFRRELELATLRHEQEEAAARRALDEKKWDKLTETFAPLARAVVARLVPGAVDKEDELLKLAASLSQEQQAAIFAFLDDDERALVAAKRWRELMTSVLHRHMDRLMAILQPHQMAMVDTIAGAGGAGSQANGAAHAPPMGGA